MPDPNEPQSLKSDEAVMARLMGEPWFCSPQLAMQHVRNGTAAGLIEAADAPAKARTAAALAELAAFKGYHQAVYGSKPPGAKTLNEIAANIRREAEAAGMSAQNSEPGCVTGSVATGARRLFFVCRTCLGAFVVEPAAKGVIACQCGAARHGDDGTAPFSEMGIRLQTSECIDVTELVECGKLSAVMPTPEQERFPSLVIFAVHNRTNRNVPQRMAVDVVRAASDGFKAGVMPSTDYMHRAALAGAKVFWHAHYHMRACGVDVQESGSYVKREATGDARFCGQVIVRDQKSEADGSILFTPVRGCARCGEDHKEPLAFWKLARPVYHTTLKVEGGCAVSELVATHFAHCPKSGEPIMMVSDAGTDASGEAFHTAAEADFRHPAPGGKVEEAVNPIDGASPVAGVTAHNLKAVAGVTRSAEFDAGHEAGRGSASITNDPHAPGSEKSENWRRGFIEGRSATHGD